MTWTGKSLLLERTEAFALQVMQYQKCLPRNAQAFSVERQMIRSATSIGANYREARQARTPREMISKLRIALGEGEEARYWLRLVVKSGLGDRDTGEELEAECHEIIKMLAATISTVSRSVER